MSVRTWIAGEIKSLTKGNSIWTNLEELDLDNGARNLPAAKTTAFFRASSRSQSKEQISGPSQLHHHVLGGNWGRVSATRLRRYCSLITGRLRLDPLSGLAQLYHEVLGGHLTWASSCRRGANRGASITKWFLHLSRVTPGIGICVRPCRGCLVPATRFLGGWRMSAGRSVFTPPVIAAQSCLLEELIGVLVGAFFLSACYLTRPGICLPVLRTRASGSEAERCLPRGISDVTSESGTSSTDRLRKNILAKIRLRGIRFSVISSV